MIADTDLLTYLGFTSAHERGLILAFAAEKDLSVRALLALSLRHYHTHCVLPEGFNLMHTLPKVVVDCSRPAGACPDDGQRYD